ncbi:MAG: hypothetical protein M3Y77_09550 [Actinomycetota bacterium]|nr:hypothetical protein [Actinomycetota bacterium]
MPPTSKQPRIFDDGWPDGRRRLVLVALATIVVCGLGLAIVTPITAAQGASGSSTDTVLSVAAGVVLLIGASWGLLWMQRHQVWLTGSVLSRRGAFGSSSIDCAALAQAQITEGRTTGAPYCTLELRSTDGHLAVSLLTDRTRTRDSGDLAALSSALRGSRKADGAQATIKRLNELAAGRGQYQPQKTPRPSSRSS